MCSLPLNKTKNKFIYKFILNKTNKIKKRTIIYTIIVASYIRQQTLYISFFYGTITVVLGFLNKTQVNVRL